MHFVSYWHIASVCCDAQNSVAIEGIADIGEALLPVGATRMTPLQTSAALTTVTGCKIGPLPREDRRLMSNKNI